MGDLDTAVEAAERWAIHDPDSKMRSAIDRLVHARSHELVELFTGRIAFGTAGLRAQVGPGPTRMNALVVRQATVGVVRWVIDHSPADGDSSAPTVLIGYDGRRDSAVFARHAAAAAIAAGARPVLADSVTPTPVVAHAVTRLDSRAAIVITASHNPPADNGYKLYTGDGYQIVSPADDEIAALIEHAATTWSSIGPAVDDAFHEVNDAVDAGAGARGTIVADAKDWTAAHIADAVAHIAGPAAQVADESKGSGEPVAGAQRVRAVYTPMHGVGGASTMAAFAEAGLAEPIVVASQFDPDPDFSTVSFPNPEEPGALDEAIKVAQQRAAVAEPVDIIVAQDPDADRLAIAVPDRSGQMRALSGDQLGVLLGDHLLGQLGAAAQSGLVARSVVSSRLLDAVAESYGALCAVTLTGFKWIARAREDHPSRTWVFGYEEAIGYCIGDHVRDKDGITAALVAVDLVQRLADRQASVWDRLDEIAAAHGAYASAPVTIRYDDDPQKVDQIIAALVASPPEVLAGVRVVSVGRIGQGALPPTPGLELHTEDRSRVIVRPSGTEPKVKAYLETIEPVGESAGGVAPAWAEANARLAALTVAVRGLLAVGE